MRDIYSNLGADVALVSAVKSTAEAGPAIDLLNANSVVFTAVTGAIAGDGDFGLKVQESDTDETGDFTDASAAVIDSNAPATLAGSSAYKLGYRGFKRFVRLALTKAGGTSIAVGAVAVCGSAKRPVA